MYQSSGFYIYAVGRDRGVFLDRHADLLLDGPEHFLCVISVVEGNIKTDDYSVGLFLGLKVSYLGKPGDILEDDLDEVQEGFVRDRL